VDGWDWAILDAQGEEIERFTEEVDAVSVARDMAKAEAEAEAEERAEAEAEAADQAATEQAESDLDSLNDIIGDLDPSTPKGRARIAYLLKIAKAM
jgi:membrane protein involved in colicin uptake